nr:Tyrosine recombinase [Ipomoea batatas]
MNFFNRPRKLAAFLLTVALLLQFCTSQTDAARVLSKKAHSSPGTMASSSSSSSETLKGGEEALKNVDSSLRKIPPSRSNPTQNKEGGIASTLNREANYDTSSIQDAVIKVVVSIFCIKNQRTDSK